MSEVLSNKVVEAVCSQPPPILSVGRFARWFSDRRLRTDRLYSVREHSPGHLENIYSLMRIFCALLLFSLYPLAFSLAQEAPATTPKPGVRLMFVPPPMEGTISMGIYDGSGKLIRALHREEELQSDAFGKALNGLITSWDGKNDAGAPMPAGKYFARGIMVGDLATEGEAMHGNDWIKDDDSPRIRRVREITTSELGVLETGYDTVEGSGGSGGGISEMNRPKPFTVSARIEGEKLLIKNANAENAVTLAGGEIPLDASVGFGDTVWAIVKSGTSIEVRAYSANGEFIRRLTYMADEPQPRSIKASPAGPSIHLLEENRRMQRVRTLTLKGTPDEPQNSGSQTQTAPPAPSTSLWQTSFTKTITFSDTLDQARGLLKFPDGKPFEPQEKIKVSLLPNPLVQDQPGSVEISAGIDAEGSYLKSTDGLLLKRISDTQNLKWAVIGREPGSKSIVLFQSDGAVVEEYRITHPANMMAFDCGDFDFDPAKIK